MSRISVVIITKNEACNISDCITSAGKISDDIIVIDTGSSDETVSIAERHTAAVKTILWQGYGHARNSGAAAAQHDWVFSLDADERITDELASAVLNLDLCDKYAVYGFKRMNYFGDKKIKYGALAHDRVFRFYNRNHCQWNNVPVHEILIGSSMRKITLKAFAVHYGIRNKEHYLDKKMNYALLCACKYHEDKKKNVFLTGVISPAFNFTKAYIFQLGFLDKRYGYSIAKINAFYTKKKYGHLQQMRKEEKQQVISFATK